MMPFGLSLAISGVILTVMFFILGYFLEEVDAPLLIQQMNIILVVLSLIAVPAGFLMAIWCGK